MHSVFQIFLIFVLIFINGIYVSAEFSIIGVRPSRIEQLAEDGSSVAKRLRDILSSRRRMDRYIATAQLGITLASLGLGMYGEPVIAHLLEEPLHDWFGLEGAAAHTVSFFFALGLITYLHVVIGEMVPKTMALQNAERTVTFLAVPMTISEKLLSWAVSVLNWIGSHVLKLLRIPPSSEESHVYTADELAMIVSESYQGGLIEEREQVLISNIIDFSDLRVDQVMTPRVDMVAVPVGIEQDELVNLIAGSIHSRFPVYEENLDHIIGLIHIKDVIRQTLEGKPFDVRASMRKIYVVPESVYVGALLDTFRRQQQHMALVINEHGGTAGIVTLEDVLEEVVGEVRDEFDTAEEEPIQIVAPGEVYAAGRVQTFDIEEVVPVDLSRHEVQTIGGFIMAELERPPAVGDVVTVGDVRITVEEIVNMAIKKVALRWDAE